MKKENIVAGRLLTTSIDDFISKCEAEIKRQQATYYPDNNIVDICCEGVRLAREYCDKGNDMEWIDIKIQKPNLGDEVLVVLGSGEQHIAYRRITNKSEEEFVEATAFNDLRQWITHWQPLPEPPNE